jgi:ABC-2 type transport system permease protein
VTGTGTLLRHFLWRDRWMLMWWSLGTMVLYWSQAVSVKGLYATQAEFDAAAASMEGNAALISMAGPARALNTVGGQVSWQATAFGAVVVGLMSMFLVVRHTRAEEESGRDELLRASVVGRAAPTLAAVLVTLVANGLAGALVAASLVSVPLAVADSVALGVGLAATGAVFTGTALIAAQLTSSPRAAYGLAGAVIALAYLLRAIGDIGTPVLTWLSPIGWYQGMYAFSGLRWWPLTLLLVAAAAGIVVALLVFARRDFGAGVLATRPGPARASAALSHGVGRAGRRQPGAVVGWTLGMWLMGLAYGSMGSDVGDLLGDSEVSREMFARGDGGLVDGFYATAIVLLALMSCGFAISSALRPRSDEAEGRVEVLLATGMSRTRWLVANMSVTVVGSFVVVVAAGLGLGTGYALATGDRAAVLDYTIATVPYVAPVLVTAAVARLLFGLAPRLAGLAWLVLGFAVVVLMFGQLFGLPGWLQALSPFDHLALVPAEEFRWAPFLAVGAVAGVLAAAGVLGFTRRDVEVR